MRLGNQRRCFFLSFAGQVSAQPKTHCCCNNKTKARLVQWERAGNWILEARRLFCRMSNIMGRQNSLSLSFCISFQVDYCALTTWLELAKPPQQPPSLSCFQQLFSFRPTRRACAANEIIFIITYFVVEELSDFGALAATLFIYILQAQTIWHIYQRWRRRH